MEIINGYRIFQGKETQRVYSLATRQPAYPEQWYWEPVYYEGDTLFWLGTATRQEAIARAMEWAHGDRDKEADTIPHAPYRKPKTPLAL